MKNFFGCSSILVMKVFSVKWSQWVGILVLALVLTLALTFSQGVKASGRGGNSLDVRAGNATPNLSSIKAGAASATLTATPTITPMPPIIAQPANPSNDPNPSFSFYSPHSGDTFECGLDGAALLDCVSPITYTGLLQDSHIFTVRNKNTGLSASYIWVIDTTPPDTTLASKPPNPSNNINSVFSFYSFSPDTTGFDCKLDGAPVGFSACSSPMTYPNLTEGPHTFQVLARDAAGNTDPTFPSYAWVVDRTSPDTSITSKPANPSNTANPIFSFSSPDPTVTFECALDDGAFALCPYPKSYAALPEGFHAFKVRAKDQAGNFDLSPASFSWTIDVTPPTGTSIGSKPPSLSNSSSASFSFSSDDVTTTSFECDLNNAGFVTCTNDGATTYIGLPDETYVIKVRAKDAAGNVDISPVVYQWVIDTQVPTITIDSQPSDPSNDQESAFSFSSVDAGATFECRLDSEVFAPCVSPVSYTALPEASHVFQARAKDAAGNISITGFLWTIDLTPPTGTTLYAAPPAISSSASALFRFFTEDITNTFECALDSGAFTAPCVSPKSYAGLAQGFHTFRIRAVDLAGNVDPAPVAYTWAVQVPKERVINGGFNTYSGAFKIPTGWVKSATFTKLDGKDTLFKKDGVASVKLVGDGKTKVLTQTWKLPAAGLGGSQFKFSFYVKGIALPAGGICKAQVVLYSASGGLTMTKTVPCPTGTYGFTKKALSFSAPWAFNKVTIQFIFNKPSGTVWFDLVSLME